MSSRPDSSRKRFAEFLEKFKSGGYSDDPGASDVDGKRKTDAPEKNDPEAKTRRARRRGYLQEYVRELWPHWKMVALLLVLALAIAGLQLIQPLFVRYIIDHVLLSEMEVGEKVVQLHLVVLLYLVVALVDNGLGIWRDWNQKLLNVRVILGLRRALFDRMIRLPLAKLADMKTGGIISRLTSDIDTTSGLLQMAVISPSVALVRLLIAIVILFSINWKLALASLAVLPFLTFLSFVFIRRIRPVYRAIRKDVSYVDGRVGEAFEGIRAVRVFSGERREEREYTVGHHSITRMEMYAHKREVAVVPKRWWVTAGSVLE